ncbi:MAG: aminoacyl-tRNA hydrolase [Alphaproteobacteria bacterium]|nr:aminoacyl-tRNA hydrolase [Alphaproteobacteria bacterium]
MLLWVGLGNPGPAYAKNRHNVGFLALEAIAARHGFGAWRKTFHGVAAEGSIDQQRIIALKPMTFMNDSGRAVVAASGFYRLEPGSITAFHDELDLAAGKVRVKRDGGNAGHNGLRSMDAHIGPDYWRVRLGIGHPGDKDRVTGHVLGDFAKADAPWLDRMIDAIADSAAMLATGDAQGFMTKVARLAPPPLPEES